MHRLEHLNLEHNGLRSLALAPSEDGVASTSESSSSEPLSSLRELRLAGNPLRCDCGARWLWREATGRRRGRRFDLPRCATPFSVRNRELVSLDGEGEPGSLQ